ncbi:MAG TPA: DUF3109 family protein [Bacteroidales bacterium]|nr:DUF3109 family protein [Bacteroidales bacterium]
MLIIENTLVADELAECMFCCDYHECKGVCCVEGDAGAPLEEEEIKTLTSSLPELQKFMAPEGINAVQKQGIFVLDMEGKKVTPLIPGGDCAFLVYKNDVAACAIEIAYRNKKISLQKPISCHLYPIRIIDYQDFIAVNYHQWHICKPALKKGKKENIYLYEFLKTPLIRRFGKAWYDELIKMAEYLRNKKINKPGPV